MLVFDRLKEVLNGQEIKEVLDIGGWKGMHTLFCASYGAKVDLVDPDRDKWYKYLEFLKWPHPLITQYQMMVHEFDIHKQYDLILLLNVIMFMKKEFVLNKLLPNINKHLKPHWKIIFSFMMSDDDMIMRENDLALYTIEEISSVLPDLKVVDTADMRSDEDHPPYGPHKHHIQYVMLSK